MGTTALKVKGKHKSSWQVYAAPVAPWRTSLQDLPLPYCLWRTIKPGTQHEKAMVLQEWQYYIGTCPASLLLLWLLLLPGHFSAFIVWLWRAVIIQTRWWDSGEERRGYVWYVDPAVEGKPGNPGPPGVQEGDRCCFWRVEDLFTALAAHPCTLPTPAPAVRVLLDWV